MIILAWILAALLVGLLVGGLASRGRGPQSERRAVASRAVRPVARLISAFVEPLFYWLGLLDPQGHPDNAKITYTAASFAADAMILVMGIQIIRLGRDVTWPFIGLVTVVLLFAAGVRYVLKVLRWKFGGGDARPGDPVPMSPGAAPMAPTSGVESGA